MLLPCILAFIQLASKPFRTPINPPGLRLVPRQRATVLVFDDAGFEETFPFQVHRFRHPRERIARGGEDRFEPKLRAASVGDEMHVLVA